ncbi:LysE/ArgO family amino acid transporter, partial [Nitratidesulfovibrio liaohensis]|uniref:LysE/ArgO family amino acid transporter n=1 Tax=Nitratidesulfovibrio liaohensis TaxID=2604158 RepID=UPI00142413F2
ALRPGTLEADRAVGDGGRTSLRRALGATLAVSLLNPHVYLDTVVMLGGISGHYPAPERLSFGAGAATASCLWFFTLGGCGRVLAPLFRKPVAWRVLDGSVCLVVWGVALSLARQAWAG